VVPASEDRPRDHLPVDRTASARGGASPGDASAARSRARPGGVGIASLGGAADDEPEKLLAGAEARTASVTEGDLEPLAWEQILKEEAGARRR
jgi:hypothetical protein